MYEATLRVATGDPDFKLEFNAHAWPITQRMMDGFKAFNSSFVCFVIAVAFALVPAMVISFLIHERESNLRHQQLVSGMNLISYWTSNYIMDIVKAEIPLIISIGLLYAYNLD